ncbi:hypothetical protein PY97_03540 [Lacticaseibacillus rhamnosus]|uniref:mucin-binding protein n=1 Tax=Lacticaseibacillus rhamnosus TaxID=47715 RepID=UPI00065AA974|nr:hypothetical protein [Lacticaseibacillus rhamnosus]KMO50147.1 hypothetical protein PY97_03540 [Lacticaseibacillus rhamnosus]
MFGLVFATALLAGGVGGMTVTQFVYADDGPFNDNRIINDVTIPTNLGDVVVFSGGVGEIGTDVQVAVPDKTGYTKDKKTVTAHVNSDGTITTSEKVTYTKAKVGDVVTGEVTVQSNLFPLILPVTGDVGSSVKVDVPSMKGYRADKSFVTVSISNTGEFSTKDSVVYTKIGSDSSSTGSGDTGSDSTGSTTGSGNTSTDSSSTGTGSTSTGSTEFTGDKSSVITCDASSTASSSGVVTTAGADNASATKIGQAADANANKGNKNLKKYPQAGEKDDNSAASIALGASSLLGALGLGFLKKRA